MMKIVPVSFLKLGDKFEFGSDRTDPAKSVVLVVTRDPAVNKIANSCHFRYQPDRSATNTDSKWNDTQSWNGTPDVQVRLIEARPEAPVVSPTVAPPAVVTPPVATPPIAAPKVDVPPPKVVKAVKKRVERVVEKKARPAPKRRRAL